MDGSRFPAITVRLADGSNVVVRRCGANGLPFAPPIVLMHGISSGASSWADVAITLEAHGPVIAWDAPGYGESTPLPMPAPRAEDYAERLGLLLDALRVDRCVLVGHSLGCLMAAAFTAQQPARVARLVLISPASGYGATDKAAEAASVRDNRLVDLARLGIAGLAERLPARLLSPRATEAQRERVRSTALRLNPAGYAQAVEMLCAADIGRHAGQPRPPTRVFCGEHDIVTPPAACRRVAAAFDAPYAAIPAAGHASPIEQPDAVTRAITTTITSATAA